MNKNLVFLWLNEIADEKPDNFSDYFYDDIRNFVINNEQIFLNKWNSIFKCQSKNELLEWLQETSGHIIMELDIDSILENYLT